MHPGPGGRSPGGFVGGALCIPTPAYFPRRAGTSPCHSVLPVGHRAVVASDRNGSGRGQSFVRSFRRHLSLRSIHDAVGRTGHGSGRIRLATHTGRRSTCRWRRVRCIAVCCPRRPSRGNGCRTLGRCGHAVGSGPRSDSRFSRSGIRDPRQLCCALRLRPGRPAGPDTGSRCAVGYRTRTRLFHPQPGALSAGAQPRSGSSRTMEGRNLGGTPPVHVSDWWNPGRPCSGTEPAGPGTPAVGSGP